MSFTLIHLIYRDSSSNIHPFKGTLGNQKWFSYRSLKKKHFWLSLACMYNMLHPSLPLPSLIISAVNQRLSFTYGLWQCCLKLHVSEWSSDSTGESQMAFWWSSPVALCFKKNAGRRSWTQCGPLSPFSSHQLALLLYD